jgi:hypothetical protein
VIGALLLIALLAFAPVGVLVAAAALYRRLAAGSDPSPRRRHPSAPPRRPIQVVAADLRRLHRQLELVPSATPQPRGRALLAAYDDVLAEAAMLLEVPEALHRAPEGWDRDGERLRVEARLAGAGLRVHD